MAEDRLPDSPENPTAGFGPVVLDIGDDVGAVIVTMPLILFVLLDLVAVVVGLWSVENVAATVISVGLCVLHAATLTRVILQATADRRRALASGAVA